MLANDKRALKNHKDNFLLAVLHHESYKQNPAKLIKFRFDHLEAILDFSANLSIPDGMTEML